MKIYGSRPFEGRLPYDMIIKKATPKKGIASKFRFTKYFY
jgi:hypothetical protein